MLEVCEDSQQTQPKIKNPIVRIGRLVESEQPSGSSAQEIDKRVLFDCKSTNVRTGRLVEEQPPGLFTQSEGIDVDFSVFGLPQAENFRVRELVNKIESHPHREALQADLQQNTVYNPFSDDSKAMIREMGNVELFEL